MKKTLVALAALAVVGAASAQSSVTLYGKMDMSLNSRTEKATALGVTAKTKNNVGPEVNSSAQNGSRWGLKGTEDLGGGMSANFILESGITADVGGAITGFNRTSMVGLSGGFGAITLGTQYSPYDSTLSGYDPHGATGSSAWGYVLGAGSLNNLAATPAAIAGFGGAKGANGFHADGMQFGSGRVTNSIMYATPNMGGFFAEAMWAPGENKNPVAGVAQQSASSYAGFRAGYNNGPLGVTLGYESLKTAAGGNTSDKTTAWALAAQYDLGVAKVHAIYERAKNDGAAVGGIAGIADGTDSGWGLGVSIPLGSVNVGLSYARETHDSETVGLRDGRTSAFGVQAIYPLSKRTRLYTSYVNGKSQNAAVAGAAVSTKTSAWNVGMQHDF